LDYLKVSKKLSDKNAPAPCNRKQRGISKILDLNLQQESAQRLAYCPVREIYTMARTCGKG
jgi:hypothetical protein